MVVGCVSCATKFVVPDEKVPESGIKVRCSKCQQTFYIKKEKPKRGGPSSVVLIDPELIAEVQRSKAESDTFDSSEKETPASAADMSAPTAAVRASAEQKPESTRIVPVQGKKSGRPTTPLKEAPSEEMLELSEVYLPPDWTKRITAAILALMALAIVLGVAIIIRNDFQIPAARDAFTVLLHGPKKRNNPLPPIAAEKRFDVRKTGTDALTTALGVRVVAVQAEVKNNNTEAHGGFVVQATLGGPDGESLRSERPCGTRLDTTRLVGLQSEAELDALYTLDGEGGANKSVPSYESVTCSVVFFAAPEWAERPETRVDLVLTKVDGGAPGK